MGTSPFPLSLFGLQPVKDLHPASFTMNRPRSDAEPSAIVVIDPRPAMDLTLELTFVLAAKTVLSEEWCLTSLPMRFDLIFEKYMRLAALVLDAPELDFAQSSRSFRQFAKVLERNRFVTLNTGREGELAGETPGLVVIKINHSAIDDIYPDNSVFAVVAAAGADEGYGDSVCDAEFLEAMDGRLSEDADHASEDSGACEASLIDSLPFRSQHPSSCERYDGGQAPSLRVTIEDLVRKTKQQQTQKMLLLEDLFSKEEAKASKAERRIEKQALKAIEKEWRKVNLRPCEHVRGQKHSSNKYGKKGKYDTILSGDAGTKASYAEMAHGPKAALMMLDIQSRGKHPGSLENGLAVQRILGAARPMISLTAGSNGGGACSITSSPTGNEAPCAAARPTVAPTARAGLERPEDAFARSEDDRRAAREARYGGGAGPSTARAAGDRASLKVSRKLRELLVVLGFVGSRSLADLPAFAELRRAYKKALLALHPDKLGRCDGSAEPTSGSPEEHIRTTAALYAMDFKKVQQRFEDLQGRFYDKGAEDFRADVKAHLPRHVVQPVLAKARKKNR